MPDLNTRWPKIDIIAKVLTAIAAIVLPIIILHLGNQYTEEQKKLEAARQEKLKEIEMSRQRSEGNASRLSMLVDQLSSENIKKRQMAIVVAEYLGKKDQLPQEIIPVLIATATSDPNKVVSADARQSLENIADRNPALAKTIIEGLASSPPLVYIQYAKNSQEAKANKIRQDLQNAGFSAPGIENVGDDIGPKPIIPQNNEIRYFKESDRSHMDKIMDILKSNGIANVRQVFLPVRNPGPIEIWFSANN